MVEGAEGWERRHLPLENIVHAEGHDEDDSALDVSVPHRREVVNARSITHRDSARDTVAFKMLRVGIAEVGIVLGEKH